MSWGISTKQNDEILSFINENPYCGIIAPTGSGKSTSMIEKIFKDGGADRIFISEPTIPAARALREEMSKRLGKNVVGYAAEGEIKYDNSTNIIYCTSGHLRRKMLSYFTKGRVQSGAIDFCSVMVIDEAHNGSIDNDVIIELWIQAAEQGATVPYLILASATLSKESTIFSQLPTIEIKTVSKHIDLQYAPKDYSPESRLLYTDLALTIARKHSEMIVPLDDASKWLVFCSGSSEVENVCAQLRMSKLDNVLIYPAYSKLTAEQLAEIFKPVPFGYRSIIVSTNIAEASITIDGLDGVFDSLTEKVSEASSSDGFRLLIKNISKSSANQRKGRTGRTRPGFCYRMCTEKYFNSLPEQREAEISRVPLTNVIVELLNVGLNPAELFKTRVSPVRMKETINILHTLKMIDNSNNVTEMGNFATLLPLGVRNSSIIYNWMNNIKREDGTRYPVYPIVVLAVLLDSYGPSYYYYPKKEEGQSFKEFEMMKEEHYDEYFAEYQGGNDIESLLKMWNVMINEFKSLKPGYESILEWSKKKSFNNKKIQEVIKTVGQCCSVLSRLQEDMIAIGPFNEKKVFNMAEPLIKQAYFNFIFSHTKSGIYVNSKTSEYFRLDRKQAVNIKYKDNPSKIIALRTAEITGAGKKSSNVISLFMPTK